MNKIIVPMLILLMLSIAGCVSYNENMTDDQKKMMDSCIKDVKQNKIVTDNTDFDKPEISKVDYCYNRLSQQARDFKICSYIGHSELKDFCFYNYAIGTRDLELCSSIQIDAMKRNCQYMVKPKFLVNVSSQ